MTRFARASGSKSSNQRIPQNSTPWNVMKEELVKKKHEKDTHKMRLEMDKVRQKNYDNFVEERQVKVENVWADVTDKPKTLKTIKKHKMEKQTQQNKMKKAVLQTNVNEGSPKIQSKKPKPQKKAPNQVDGMKKPKKIVAQAAGTGVKSEKQKQRIEKLKLKRKQNRLLKQQLQQQQPEKTEGEAPKKRKNRKRKPNPETKESPAPKTKKRKQNTDPETTKLQKTASTTAFSVEKTKFQKPLKKGKVRDDKIHPRRKPADANDTYIKINDITVPLERFDGFFIKAEDAENLHKLKNDMQMRGIPNNEIRRALILERRRAERSLGREKKSVCYQCRKSGHNLSACPETMGNVIETTGTGICFKCGSTEHTHYQCKVVRSDSYKFASCFICKEQGHISKQCPDNPRGLYPKGGACKLCGDVTHYRKDCPTAQTDAESNDVVANTIGDDIEALESDKSDVNVPKKAAVRSKVVKF